MLKTILVLISILGLLVIEIVSRSWHQSVSSNVEPTILDFPDLQSSSSNLGYEGLPIDPRQVTGLAYDRGLRYWWKNNAEGMSQQSLDLVYLEYKQGTPHCFADMFYHSPEVCMASAGELLSAERRSVSLQETKIGVRVAVFREFHSKTQLYIYKATWFPSGFPVILGVNDHLKKWQTALVRQETPPARMMTAALRGFADEGDAWEFFQEKTLRLLEPSS